jgi:hypothetical protein
MNSVIAISVADIYGTPTPKIPDGWRVKFFDTLCNGDFYLHHVYTRVEQYTHEGDVLSKLNPVRIVLERAAPSLKLSSIPYGQAFYGTIEERGITGKFLKTELGTIYLDDPKICWGITANFEVLNYKKSPLKMGSWYD